MAKTSNVGGRTGFCGATYIYRLGGRRCFGQRSLPREETLTATVPARHAYKKRKGQRFDAATANAVPQGIAPTAAALTH